MHCIVAWFAFPQELVLQMLKDAMIKKAASSKGFLIDGYPRELEQGIRFEKEVAQVECAIYFKVADETMKKRLLKRAETSGRSDDNEKTIVTRIQTFHQTSQPVIDYYTKQNRICVVCRKFVVRFRVVANSFCYIQKCAILDKITFSSLLPNRPSLILDYIPHSTCK